VEKQAYKDWATRAFVESIHDGSVESLQASLRANGLLSEN